jgi:uncharacterized damage-inducible protein DinB
MNEPMTALTGAELLAWVEATSSGWRQLLAAHPEALAIPCDVRESTSVRELLHHIVAVELRYAQRLQNLPETSYDDVSMVSVEDLYATHDRAMTMLRELIANPDFAWEEQLDFVTRSLGTLRASRRTILIHTLMHSIRHYAQLATLVRQHGVKPDFPMDYLFMGAQPK